MQRREIEAVNRVDRQVMLGDGTILPIVNLYDGSGEETENMDEARAAVAGAPGIGWFAFALADYERPITN